MKLERRKSLLAACICTALFNCTAFAAETTEPMVNTTVGATEEAIPEYTLGEIVTTATKTKLSKKEVPQTVEVITKKEIQNLGAGNVKEALRLVPNVDVTEVGGIGNNIGIRGSRSNDVLVLLNGHRVVGESLLTGYTGTNQYILERLNVNNIERIEVLKGPAGALYGSDAQAGVINIITGIAEKPSFTVGVMSNSREMGNYYHFDSGLDNKLSATFDASFNKVRYFKWDDVAMSRYYGPKQNYNLNLDYAMDDNNKLNLFAEYDKQNMSYEMMGMLRAHRAERKSMTLTYDGENKNSNYMLSAGFSNLYREDQDRTYRSYNVEARDTIKTDKNNRLTFGGEYRKDKMPIRQLDGSYPTDGTSQYALYLYDEFRLGDKLLLIPSVRYDHHSSFGSRTSPNLGATYFINDTSRFKASYGSAYRAPSAAELYYEGTGSMMSLKGNPNLKPEKTKGYEISFEKDWAKTEAKITYFNNNKEDAISTYQNPLGYYEYYNVDKTKSKGVEFSIKHDLGNGFTLSGDYNYLDSINEDTGARLTYNAKNTYVARLSWDDPQKNGWNVTAWNKWYTDYKASDSKDYSINTFNFVVNKRWGEKYRAYFGLDNVFNKEMTELRYSGRLWRFGAEMTFQFPSTKQKA